MTSYCPADTAVLQGVHLDTIFLRNYAILTVV